MEEETFLQYNSKRYEGLVLAKTLKMIILSPMSITDFLIGKCVVRDSSLFEI